MPALAPRHNPFVDDRRARSARGVLAEIDKRGDLKDESPLRICCQTMLRSLDPYSGVITPAEEHRTIGINPEHDGLDSR